MMKQLRLIIMTLLAIFVSGSSYGEDVVLFEADFSQSPWAGHTFTHQEEFSGIYCYSNSDKTNCGSISAGGVMTYMGGGNKNSNRYFAVKLSNINKKFTVVLTMDGSKNIRYSIGEETDYNNSTANSSTDLRSAAEYTVDYTMTKGGSSAIFYFGQQGTSQTSGLKGIKITTPGASGEDATVVEDPVIIYDNLEFYDSQDVTITCGTDGATIYYSTDGSSFVEYTGAITLTESTTLYAKATKNGLDDSQVVGPVAFTKISKELGNPVSDKTWDFTDWANGDMKQSKTIDDLTIYASSSKYVTFESNNASIDNLSFTKRMKTNGASSEAERVIAFRVEPNVHISVYGTSGSSGSARPLKISEGTYGNEVASKDVDGIDKVEYDYTGNSVTTIYLWSNANVQFRGIVVTPIETDKITITAAYDPEEIELVNGDEFTAPTLVIATADGAPVEGLPVAYESDNEAVATVSATGEISLAGGVGEANITATVDGGDTYTSPVAKLKITVSAADEILDVTENIQVDLTKANIESNGYLAVTTDNWQTDKTYDGVTGDFYNMSKSDRQLSIKVKGAKVFEILVQNSSSGRSYTYQIDGGEAQTVDHSANGVESSGLIACSDDVITITLAGNSGSVYPVAIKFYTELPSIDVELNKYGYATLYYSDKAFTVPEGVTATTYTADVKESKVYAAGDVIPADEAVVLQGTANAVYTFVTTLEAGEPDANNALRGLNKEGKTVGNGLFYMLSAKDGKVGFYWGKDGGAAFTTAAHKAYLVVPASAEAKGAYVFGETTGIESSLINAQGKKDAVYNLNGQRVSESYKGVIIVNGKKMINK